MNGQADASYKFGAGRFVMEHGLLERIGDELAFFGKKPYFIGGPRAMEQVRQRLETGLAASGLEGVFGIHPGQVCHEAAREKAQEAMQNGCDLVVAVGGGRAMDFGKLAAYYAHTRAACLPTSISTCAAYSPFSLTYTPEGRAIPGNFCYDLENAAIWIDLEVMAAQPARYVTAGMLDAMAKAVEIKNGSRTLERAAAPLALYAGYLLAQFSFDRLKELIDGAMEALAGRKMNQALEDMIFLNIPVTGIISGLSKGVGQSAIAHALYYQLRTLFPKETMGALHGEIVGLGILPQLVYNGEEERVQEFAGFLEHVGAPTCLTDVGFPLTGGHYQQLLAALEHSGYVGNDPASRKRFYRAMDLVAK